MNDNILTSTKTIAGLVDDYDSFDNEIIMYINSVFLVLKQLGVGPAKGFVITDKEATWDMFVPDDDILRETVKSYMGAKVKMQFDPPTQTSVSSAYENTIKELEFRLSVESDGFNADEETSSGGGGTSGEGGVNDYTKLSNLPSINGKILVGNYNEQDPTVQFISPDDVDDIWDEEFGGDE